MKIQWLYNPFLKIAGGKSLFWGVIILFGTSLLGFINNVHYDGIIDVHSGMPAPFYIFIGETALSWIIFSILLFVTATIFSTSKVRIIDFFGTQAFAKYPYLLISVLSFIPFFKYEYKGFPEITISILIFALITLVLTIWSVILMYNAYSVSANLSGPKAVVSFIIALLIAEILFKIIFIKSYPFLIQYSNINNS